MLSLACHKNKIAMESSISNKRRRHGHHNTMQTMRLIDLPESLLPKIASFLPQPACISFAISMTKSSSAGAPSTSARPTKLCCDIAKSSKEGWEYIDFKYIQDILGRPLSDDDIRWVLQCIDAPNKTKSLKFTHCLNITGIGLEPIRGSAVLQQIDLSLVGDYESPIIDPVPPISMSVVVPILNSILDVHNSLVHVQFPKSWREERSDLLTNFLRRFDRELHSRRLECQCTHDFCDICYGICAIVSHKPLVDWADEGEYNGTYGMNTFACYQCLKRYCDDCYYLNFHFCVGCEKFFCKDCNPVSLCRECGKGSCEKCGLLKECGECSQDRGSLCLDCEQSWTTCPYCEDEICSNCVTRCKGEGCSRLNCLECGSWRACDAPERVRACSDEDTNIPNYDHEFCLDCRVKFVCETDCADKQCKSCKFFLWMKGIIDNETCRNGHVQWETLIPVGKGRKGIIYEKRM